MRHWRLGTGAAIDLLAIASLWWIAVALVNPVGDFPLNDDWSYGRTVQRLVLDRNYVPTGWASIPLVTHVLWGALFTLPAGFSFTALRFSTLVLSLVGVCGLYLLIRQLNGSRLLAVISALALAFNPVYFALSHTFMADVPFTTWLTLATLFFVRSLQSGSTGDLIAATAFSVAATLTRQVGACVPIAFACTLVIHRRIDARVLLRALVPVMLVVASLVAFEQWLEATGRLPALYGVRMQALWRVLGKPTELPLVLGVHVWTALMYLGCFSLPLFGVMAAALRGTTNRTRVAWIGPVILLGLSVARFAANPSVMPVGLNVLVPQGIGPLSVRAALVPPLAWSFWLCVTLLSLLGAIVLLLYVFRLTLDLVTRWKTGQADVHDQLRTFFLLSAAAYFAPLMPIFSFDRYFMAPMVFIMGCLALQTGVPSRRWYVASILGVACFAVFAVAGTRDYLAWNRLRWQALNELLTRQNLTPADVDGGFEFNGWHLYDAQYVADPNKSPWWVVRDDYVLALSELSGYDTIGRYPYHRWLPPYREGSVLVLKRKSAP